MTVDPRYFNKRGNIKLGDCYEKAALYLLEHPKAILVHGSHRNPDGIEIAHAWIEENTRGPLDDPVVLETTTGTRYLLGVWYHNGINKAFKRYTIREAMKRMVQKGATYGPWDEVSRAKTSEALERVKVKEN